MRTFIFVVTAVALTACKTSGGTGDVKDPGDKGSQGFELNGKGAPIDAKTVKPNDGSTPSAASAVLDIMANEIDRWLKNPTVAKNNVPLYYLSYQVFDQRDITMDAQGGAIVADMDNSRRQLDTVVRVGSPKLDNTTSLSNQQQDALNQRMLRRGRFPEGTDAQAIAEHLWLDTDRRYREALINFRAAVLDKQLVTKKNKQADFAPSEPVTFVAKPKAISFDKDKWLAKLRDCSKRARQPPATRGSCRLELARMNSYFVNSEGSKIQTSRLRARLSVSVGVKAPDGMSLSRNEQRFAERADELADPQVIDDMIQSVTQELRALHDAPIVDPYVGPAILEGRAAGVFFHEVFGHRIEGHRQTSDVSGKTFSSKVGERIMPPWLSVYDDPRLASLNNMFLNGFYRYDDEGVKAQRVDLVKDGVLKQFLQGRQPIKGFPKSNGHGRKEPGHYPVSRQGNLVISVEKSVPNSDLEKLLMAEVKRQGKPFGMIFSDISGGFTNTSKFLPQAFKVNPVMAYRLYPDGRRELVRGVDIVGTPLTALGNILASGDKMETFNGMCGAESGWVPVSASAPSLLLKSLEVERGFDGVNRAPILDPPGITATKGASK